MNLSLTTLNYVTAQQKNYNYLVCRAQNVTEIAYGHLKARWDCLSKGNDMNIDNIPHITNACLLYNICEVHHEHFKDAWLQTEGEYAQPDALH